jgi:hypothetical protein
MSTPIYDRIAKTATVILPDDVHVWSEDDNLTTVDAPAVNGTANQTGGLTL